MKTWAPKPVPMSSGTFDVFWRAAELSALTGGALDVTVGPLVNAWGFGFTTTRFTGIVETLLVNSATPIKADKSEIWFAFTVRDIGKGITGGMLPLSATLATESWYETFLSEDRARAFFHGHTFTANPIACAAAVANLAIWREEDVLGRIKQLAQTMADRLATRACSPAFANPRQAGTIVAIDLVTPDAGYLSDLAPSLRLFFQDRGLLLRPLGNTIYLMPPYCLDAQQLDRIFAALHAAGEKFGLHA